MQKLRVIRKCIIIKGYSQIMYRANCVYQNGVVECFAM